MLEEGVCYDQCVPLAKLCPASFCTPRPNLPVTLGISWHLCPYGISALMVESEEKLKGLLIKVKEESEKVGLKLNFQEIKIMAFGPITSWQIDDKTVKTVTDFIFGGLQNHCR